VALANNIGIAFGCNIENALGGGGRERLGSELANLARWRCRADMLQGNGGDDLLRGGTGKRPARRRAPAMTR
jgi:serralysin